MTGSQPPVTNDADADARIDDQGRPKYALMAVIVAAVLALDQATKSWAVATLADGRAIHLFWTLELDLAFNSGFAFSQGTGLTGLIPILVVALIGGIVWWSRGVTSSLLATGLALLLGGACGNLADRLFRDHDGAVVDFIDLQWWPVFNVADIAVFFGAGLLILSSLRQPTDP